MTFKQLFALLSANKSFLTLCERQQLESLCLSTLDFYKQLLECVKERAIAPISNFYVAALAIESIEKGGRVFFGANLEFKAQALSLVVHAEQSALHNAYLHGAGQIETLVINAQPCGYCRQFINEIAADKQPCVSVDGVKTSISDLLPNAFGPQDLGNQSALFSEARNEISNIKEAHSISYAPYTKNKSSCEIITETGIRKFGVYIENAAYSPSMSPLQGALNQLQLCASLNSNVFDTITEINLIQTQGSENQLGVAKAVASSLNKQIEINEVKIPPNKN